MFKVFLASIAGVAILSGCNESNFSNATAPVTEPEQAAELDAEVRQPEETVVNVLPSAIIEDSTVEARNPAEASDSSFFSFTAAEEVPSSFIISLDDKMLMTAFKLTNNYSDQEQNHTQINRTPLTEQTQQGNPGQPKTDAFDQEEKKGLLDILVVIDDSGSMSQEQQNLSTKLNDLLSAISQTDWKIGVVTTTPKNDCEITLINAGDADAMNKFKMAVEAGTNGSGNEKGIKEAVNGLRCTENPWLRANSSIAVLIVSDEDNCSNNGSGCQGEDWNTPQYLIDYVQVTLGKTVGVDAGFYGIFSDPDDPCNTAYNNATQYKQLVEYNANGKKNYGDICDASYATTLNLISQNISGLLRNQWELTATPDAGTLTVYTELAGVQTLVDAGDYTLAGRTLTFNAGKEPPAASKVIANYTVGKTPMFKEYTLAQDPAAGTLSVKVNGTPVNNYTLAGRKVTFAQEPVADATVMFDYRKNMPLLTDFAVAGTPKENVVAVFVDDVATNDFTYDANTKMVKFNQAPLDLAKIKIAYVNFDGPELSYTLPIGGQNPRDFKLFYNETQVNFQKDGNQVTIGEADHEENRTLVLKYQVDDTEVKMFPLPEVPVNGTLELVTTNMDCSLGNGFEVVDMTLVSSCVVQEMTDFELKYNYIGLRRNFTAPVAEPELGQWRVYIDGVETTDYTREGTGFTINADLPLGANVSIYYEYGS